MLDLEFAELSDPGLQRDHNEDALGHVVPASKAEVQSQGWIFALADGVGGHDEGEEASRLAVETVLDGFRKIPKGVMHVSLLPKLVQEANVRVYDRAHEPRKPGAKVGYGRMATTLVLCALRFDSAVVSHVGDSRCYLFRQGSLAALTRDHTMAGGAGAAGDSVEGGGERRRDAARADAERGVGAVCSGGYRNGERDSGRRAAAVFRRPAWVCGGRCD